MSAISCSSVKQRREKRLLIATIPAIWSCPTIGSRMTTPRFLPRRRQAGRVVLGLEVREAGRPICATLRHHLVKDVVLVLEREDEHVVDRRVHHDGRRRGRLEVARRDRALEGDLVLRSNCGLELAREGAELLGVRGEDEAGERGLVDEGAVRRRRRWSWRSERRIQEQATGRSCHSA
jgi:hypothetical protein